MTPPRLAALLLLLIGAAATYVLSAAALRSGAHWQLALAAMLWGGHCVVAAMLWRRR